jgi:membrane protein YqaA with SNARE-associated domain
MLDLWGWMGTLVTNYGYVGAFLISLFGNFTIFFPVPFAITIYAFGATLNPIILGVVCGIGSTIGEFSAYLVGMGGRKVLEERYGDRLEYAKRLIEKHGMAVVFIFALLPLPDDLLLIPLGMLRYDIRKVMIAAFFGKVGMCLTIAFAGRFSFVFVKEIFESGGILGGVLSVALLAIVIVGMLVIDWSKFVNLDDVEA